VPHSVLPQERQKQSPHPGVVSYRLKLSSPDTQEKEPGVTSAYAEPAPLKALRQREQ
jgi:hypothetical protein